MKKYTKKCQMCGVEMKSVGASKKFCQKCRRIKNIESAKRSREKTPMKYLHDIKEQEELMYARGKEVSRDINCHKSLTSVFDREKRAKISISFCVPFSSSMSKNAILGVNNRQFGSPRFYKKVENRQQEEFIAKKVASSCNGFKQNKIWIEIFVEKPNHNSDAVNVVDLICDAVKKGIGVDDRWFSLGGVDWSIVKDREPQVFIKIYQEDNWDARVCSVCGRILPEKCYRGKKQNRCQECSRKNYSFSEDDLMEMIKAQSIPDWYGENLTSEDEKQIQLELTREKIYGEDDC